MIIISLIEEHILPILTEGSMLLQDTVPAYTMLHAELLPKLIADYSKCKMVTASTYFDCHIGQLEV
jgi:hypothetical protein